MYGGKRDAERERERVSKIRERSSSMLTRRSLNFPFEMIQLMMIFKKGIKLKLEIASAENKR